jgi:hypothetical protein
MARHAVGLYVNISGIRWDYDAPADEIKGALAKNGSVIEVNVQTKDRFAIADNLWNMIETA